MKYNNIYIGIKKIFISEVLQIIASIFALVGMIFLNALINNLSISGAAVGTAFSLLVGVVVTVIALVIYLIGLVQARKEEREFHLALVVTIIALAVEIAAAVVDSVNPTAASWLEFACEILELVAFESVVSGVVNIAKEVGDEKILSIGRKMRVLVTAIWIIMIAVKLLEFFAGDIAEILKIVHYVLEIIDHIFYMILLLKGRKMIADISAYPKSESE